MPASPASAPSSSKRLPSPLRALIGLRLQMPSDPPAPSVIRRSSLAANSRVAFKHPVGAMSSSLGPTAFVPPVRVGFSPLDDELALLPSRYTPHVHEAVVRLGAWMPFTEAAALVDHMLGVQVTADTVRRHTEAAGDAYVAHQTVATEGWLQGSQETPTTTDRLLVSADGAMVPLVAGEWAEVKTLAVGTVAMQGETTALSYFSRLCDAATFTELATVETCRRGVPQAHHIAAVVDGAEWLQSFLEVQCPQAVRILDFPHAAQRVGQIGQELLGKGSAVSQAWLPPQLHVLKHQGPQPVLEAIRTLVGEDAERAQAVAEDVSYLEKRVGQMHYPVYQAGGWPIGSGMVESANKLVVEVRLKGAGMHWARANVNGMLALRNIVCSDRWAEAWRTITTKLRQQTRAAQRQRHAQRQAPPAPPVEGAGRQGGGGRPSVPVEVLRAAVADDNPRPHPWKRAWSVRQQAQEADRLSDARL